MNIILDGPDNCGKSTLAAAISAATGWHIKDKEGRPATRDELIAKLLRYEKIDGMIIDRHPIISQSVYGLLRGDDDIPEAFIERFFARDDLIIYCRALRSLDDHEPSDTDTPEHLTMIEDRSGDVLDTYDNWAAICANIIYFSYDQTDMVIAMVMGVLNERR